jgi:protein SCO1/2
MQNKSIISLVIASILALVGYNIYLDKKSNSPAGAVVKPTTTVATSSDTYPTDNGSTELIGGEYELTDQNGNRVKSESFLGKKQIVFFGFTNCPMICPTAVNNVSLVMEELHDVAASYTPIFITVDPERDTPERLKDYFANMHKSFVALTGTAEEIEAAKKAFKVYAEKTESGDDINHSSIIYILDENGAYMTHFSHETSVEKMAKKLRSYED